MERTWRCNIKIGYSLAFNQKQSPSIDFRRRKFSNPVSSFLDLFVDLSMQVFISTICEHVTSSMAPIAVGSELRVV